MNDLRIGDPNHLIECGKKAFRRGGNFLQEIFNKSEKFLTKEECMKLYNTYGIPAYYLTLLAISHEFEFDEKGFCEEIEAQQKRMKRCVQC